MNTLKIYLNNICTIIFIMVLASFIGASFAYSDDNNRYREDTSRVFAPGYLNAAKYHAEHCAEAAVNRQTPDTTTFFDQVLERISTALKNSVKNDAKNKVRPEVKGPRGGGQKAVKAQASQAQEKTKAPEKGPGDVNGDGIVDGADFNSVSRAYGTKEGQAGYNSAADFNKDGYVNGYDLTVILSCYGRTYTYDTTTKTTESSSAATNQHNNTVMAPNAGTGYPENDYATLHQSDYGTNESQKTVKIGNDDLPGAGKTALTQPQKSTSEKNASYALTPEIMYKGAELKDEMNRASVLSAATKNPADEQKVIMDSVKALLTDVNKVEKESGNIAPELKKAENDLLNAVANILLAQAMPDLLKKGDIANVRAIFSELDSSKGKIMLEYAKSTKPYYENMLKDLAKNMAILQLKNILNPNITKEELAKLPPSELDKILEKMKKEENRAFEEEYLLQQEAKYRKAYLDPSKKKLEDDMKGMLTDFTGKINDVLKATERK